MKSPNTKDQTQGEVSTHRPQRNRETRAITVGAALICALVVMAAVVPAVDLFISQVVSLAMAAAAVAALLRWAARRLRWSLEDRLDARIAAAWRAENSQQAITVVAASAIL